MKLYLAPGACSLSPHIALREAGLSFDIERIDLGTKETACGIDMLAASPKASLPALQLDDGTILTEGPAIVEYIADLKPEAKLAPAAGTLSRYQHQEWLNFIATEVQKNFGALFNPKASEDTKAHLRALIARRLAFLDQALARKPYLMGYSYTVADSYLFTALGLSKVVQVDLTPYPALTAFLERIAARPAVKAALAAELS